MFYHLTAVATMGLEPILQPLNGWDLTNQSTSPCGLLLLQKRPYFSSCNVVLVQNFFQLYLKVTIRLYLVYISTQYCHKVGIVGLEPTRIKHQILSLARLPIPPYSQVKQNRLNRIFTYILLINRLNFRARDFLILHWRKPFLLICIYYTTNLLCLFFLYNFMVLSQNRHRSLSIYYTYLVAVYGKPILLELRSIHPSFDVNSSIAFYQVPLRELQDSNL